MMGRARQKPQKSNACAVWQNRKGSRAGKYTLARGTGAKTTVIPLLAEDTAANGAAVAPGHEHAPRRVPTWRAFRGQEYLPALLPLLIASTPSRASMPDLPLLDRGWEEVQEVPGDHAGFAEFLGGEVAGPAVEEDCQAGGFERREALAQEGGGETREDVARAAGGHPGVAGGIDVYALAIGYDGALAF